jgi:hypothetical protein
MNVRLQKLLADAETLPRSEQDRLAEFLETYLDTHRGEPDFTEDELADLKRLDAEPFEPASHAAIKALFARPG